MFVGATGGSTATVAVAAEMASPDPPAFVAVTTTLRVSPTSLEASTRVLPVAPLIAEQLAPDVLQSSHW